MSASAARSRLAPCAEAGASRCVSRASARPGTGRSGTETSHALSRLRPTLFELRAVAECFSVVPAAVEWTFTLHAAPRADADSIGWLVSRVTAGKGQELIYRSKDGKESRVTPDWVETDWGYEYLMDQTMLDRRGDWFQLPRRPFPVPRGCGCRTRAYRPLRRVASTRWPSLSARGARTPVGSRR